MFSNKGTAHAGSRILLDGWAGREALARRFAEHRKTQFAIQESLDGKNVEWLEKVTDPQYRGSNVRSET
jgi:hypothetical protein